jgi:capsular polysaccharide transport system permease protein
MRDLQPASQNPLSILADRTAPERGGYLHAILRRMRIDVVRLAAIVFLLVPGVGSAAYFGLVASDRYVSEARFIVRGTAGPSAGGFEALFRTFGLSRASDDSHAVAEYMMSRDALHDLEATLPIRDMYGDRDADAWARFPRPFQSASFEALFGYFTSHVSVIEDSGTGVTALSVTAFRADDAQRITDTLLTLAERMVNRMNARLQADGVDAAAREVALATQRVVDAQRQLTEFRHRESMLDPGRVSNAGQQMLVRLSSEQSAMNAQLSELQKNSPLSPALPPLRARLGAMRDQIGVERARLAGTEGALASKLSTYEQLALVRDVADKSLAEAMSLHERARQEAQRQRIYLELVVSPSRPDQALEPQRLRAVASVLAAGFMGFALFWILAISAREHAH